jgi:hypothetical protein
MKVNYQLHATPHITPGEVSPPVFNGEETEWAPEGRLDDVENLLASKQ